MLKINDIVSISLFTMVTLITVYAWMDRLGKRSHVINEAFEDVQVDDKLINKIMKANEPQPTDADAVSAHQTLLRYIRNDFSKGIYFVDDFRRRFFGENIRLRTDLDVQKLMDNYSSPLQRK